MKSKKQIDRLFREGDSLFKYPIRLLWISEEVAEPDHFSLRAAVAVPKRKVRKATDRNRIKRQLREVWRLEKHGFGGQGGRRVDLMLIFVAEQEVPFEKLRRSAAHLIRRLGEKVAKTERAG